MPKAKKKIEHRELTEDDLEAIHWRATRGCHYDKAMIWTSKYGIEVIENDVPLLIAEIRRLRAAQQRLQADVARRCPACNALLEETSVYCDNCGTDTPRR